MARANILMIAYTIYSADPRVMREAETAVKAGYNVDFLALSHDPFKKNEIINGVNVIYLKLQKYRGVSTSKYIISYLIFFVKAFIKTSILCTKKRFQVVHVNNMPDFFVLIALIPKILKAKVILDIHDPMPATYLTKFRVTENTIKYKLLLWQELLSARFSDKVVTVHEPLKNDILTSYGIPTKKIEVVANFADGRMFPLNHNYSFNGTLKFIFHGTISERFGLALVLKTISQLECKDKYYFKIIGEGEYSSELKNIISKYKLKGIVDFENKSYPADKLYSIIGQYNIGLATYILSPATNYMLPLKLLEYVSIGIPVITVRNMAIKYYFRPDDLFYVNPTSFEPLKYILETCIEQPSVLVQKRTRILEIRNKYLWENEGKKYINMLNYLSEAKIEKD